MAFVGPLRLFHIRARVRAYLLAVGQFPSVVDAFQPLMQDASDTGLLDQLGAPALLAIVDEACKAAAVETFEFEDQK